MLVASQRPYFNMLQSSMQARAAEKTPPSGAMRPLAARISIQDDRDTARLFCLSHLVFVALFSRDRGGNACGDEEHGPNNLVLCFSRCPSPDDRGAGRLLG